MGIVTTNLIWLIIIYTLAIFYSLAYNKQKKQIKKYKYLWEEQRGISDKLYEEAIDAIRKKNEFINLTRKYADSINGILKSKGIEIPKETEELLNYGKPSNK